MKQSLQLKLSQQLTLTPQLKQSLRLLQLPSLELEHEIQQTLDSNPLLERVEREISEPLLTDNKQVEEQKLTVDAPSNDTVSEFEQTDSLQQEQEVDSDWQNTLNNQNNSYLPANSATADTEKEFTQFISKEETLFEHLDWQIQMTTLSDKDKLIASALLHSLDDDGYLSVSLDEVCNLLQLVWVPET